MAPISFARGVPAPECLPVELLADCARAAILADGKTVLSYGTGLGYAPLREWIGERHGVDPGRVLLTNGSLQGFVYLAQHFFQGKPGGRAFVEAPTYDRPLLVLRDLGAEIVGLAMDDEGLDPDALEQALASGSKPAFVYTIPTFQNPSGRTLSAERRQRIVELAQAHDLFVLEDDPYGLVRFDGEAPPTMFELEGGDHERVIYSSSFSKTVAPGLRTGYFILPQQLVKPLELIAGSTTISPSLLPEATLVEFVRAGHFEPNLERVKGLLKARRDAMLESLDRHFGGTGASWSHPEGGYFLWLDFPEGTDADALLPRATEAGVTFVKGSDFFADGQGRGSARLAYSFVAVDEVDEGVSRLASLVGAAVA
ncbi:MAG: 2-aminoadipate transaminase [Gaiellaceae bacterium]|jgi:DNA-binding transcriptional MocR family regulator|nr:2-aminoadipate transaminase [Gaiellaceae bacterium]